MSIATLPDAVSDASDAGAYFADLHLQLLPAVPLTQDQFFEFCQQNRKVRFERTAQGELIIMAPTGGGTGKRNLSIGAQLYYWAESDATGEAYDSSTGFVLPNGANRSPDASWVRKNRLASLSPAQKEKFLPLCPDFLVEQLSPSDSLPETQEKMEEYIANGLALGWLIDPKKKQVHVYRPGEPVLVLDNPQTVSGDPELPGFVLDLEPVWRP
jgi:Uma2 family endonuclease